jgi:hypothetical protein
MFCADLVLMDTSSEGACFIQTSSLDGEKNLKKRLKPKDLNLPPRKKGTHAFFKGTIECDEPNAELYDFSGNLKIDKKSYALSAS